MKRDYMAEKRNTRSITTDAVIIRKGKLLLIKRGTEPFKGKLALPGGHLEADETVGDCVKREALEETGVYVLPLGVIGIYSDPKRTPRGAVSIAFLCAYNEGTAKAGSDAKNVMWIDVHKAVHEKLAFDHNKILEDALKMLEESCSCEDCKH